MQDNKSSWKNVGEKMNSAAFEQEESIGSMVLAAIAASIAFVGLAALVWINTAEAAISKTGADAPVWKQGKAAYSCEDRLANLYLAGSFLMPGSGESMNLWIGKPHGTAISDKEVWGLVGKASAAGCEAQCKVTRFERFKKDLKPAMMELDCEGSRLKTMRMPLHIQWARGDKSGIDTVVRLGSSIYGVEEAPLHLQVNRYAVAAK